MEPILRKHKDYKTILSYLKLRHQIGEYVFDICRSEPFKIKKNSIFEIFEFEYNDESLPEDPNEREFEFTVRDPGKHTERWSLEAFSDLNDINYYLRRYETNNN